MRSRALGLLLLASCAGEKADPKPRGDVAIVQDFEGSVRIKRWPKGVTGAIGISTAWAADGKRSMEIAPGGMASFTELRAEDWSGYSALRFTVHNPGARTAPLGLEIQDAHEAFDERHQHSFGAAPGDQVIELDLEGGLWRGEENRPYRGAIKTPLDLRRITRLAFNNGGAAPLFIDRIEIVKVPKLASPGAFAFDFGRRGQRVMAQTTGVFEDTLYAPDRGFGFLAPVAPGMRPLSYPTPLLGDGLPLGRGFRLDLARGAYLGWIAFERGGFSEDEQCGYEHADVLVNGVVVTGHDFRRDGAHRLFEDTELTDLSQIEDRLVTPAHAITSFRFDALAGENVFTLAVRGEGPIPLRVAGLMVAPDSVEGRAFLAAHAARQRAAIDAAYPRQDRARRSPPRAAPARLIVAEPLPLGADLHPRDLPEHPDGAPLDEVAAFPDHVAAAQLAVFAASPIMVAVELTPLTGPGGETLPPPRVAHGRYLPTRPLGNGPVWLAIHHYRPEARFDLGPDTPRALLVEWRVPKGTAPGLYTGAIEISGGSATERVPVRVRVRNLALPEIPVPTGLFMNALPYAPEPEDEDTWWHHQAALLDEQIAAGLDVLTGGAALDLKVRGRAVQGERALFYLALARSRGRVRAVVNYGGFFPRLRAGEAEAAAFAGAWTPFAIARDLPPFYFVAYDEPGTAKELEEAFAAAQPITQAGLRAMGFLTARRRDAAVDRLLAVTFAPAMNAHGAAEVQALSAGGRHPWAYNNGLDRWSMGLHFRRDLRAGIEGRLEWIGLITQGFAFDELDAREPANSAFLAHTRLGPMPTPRWLSAREGLTDLRIRLALEQVAAPGDPALAAWPMEGGDDRARFSDAALSDARRQMLERLDRPR